MRGTWKDSSPERRIAITKGFEIGKYEVTQEQWHSVMGTNPSHFIGADLPVESVKWAEIQLFLSKLNDAMDVYHDRLPTEAEWEYAARAGTGNTIAATGPPKPLGVDAHGHHSPVWVSTVGATAPLGPPSGTLDEIAWYAAHSGGHTHPVGGRKPKAW